MLKNNSYITIQSWMITDLHLSGTELIVYAVIYGFSQDNESKFEGSRQYLADWCGCTVRNIQIILNNLTERGLLIKHEEFKNGIKYCRYEAGFTTSEKTSPPSENISLPSENISRNKLANKLEDNKGNNTKVLQDSEFDNHMYSKEDFIGSGKKEKPKQLSLFDKCCVEINNFTDDEVVRKKLIEFLTYRIRIKDKPLVCVNFWKSILSKLDEVYQADTRYTYIDIIQQSLDRQWLTFYPIKSGVNKTGVFAEPSHLSCEQSSDTAEEREEILRQQGRQSRF